MNKFHYDIRPANASDAVAIATIGYNTWQDIYKDIIPKEFLNSIDLDFQIKRCEHNIKNGSKIFVASDENRYAIGYISYSTKSRDIINPHENELLSIYVDKKLRSNGLGSLLLFEVERLILTSKPIMLRVLKDNHKARIFFEENGYRYCPSRDGRFRNLAPDVAYVKSNN